MDPVPTELAVRCARHDRWTAALVTTAFASGMAAALALAPHLPPVLRIVFTVVALAFCAVPAVAGAGATLRAMRLERLAARPGTRIALLGQHLVIEPAHGGLHYLEVDRRYLVEAATPRARVVRARLTSRT